MQLQLAILLSNSESSCLVQLLESKERIEASYAKPMVEHQIFAYPGDLVAITLHNKSFRIVFRWKRVQVEQIESNSIQVHDTIGQIYSLPLTTDFQEAVTVGGSVFTDNTAVSDVVVGDLPSNPARFHNLYFPKIRAMYAQMEAAEKLNPKKVVAQGYDQIAEKHLDWSRKIRIEERERYTSLVLAKVPQGAKVLDLGCGAGLLTTKKLAKRFQVTGVDISMRHIEMAQENVPNATFIHADMTEIDFPPESLDGIVAFYSLFHLPREEQNQLLQRVSVWLRPGGLFVATLGVHSISGDIDENWLGTTMYWSSHDNETNKHLVQASGLQIISANEETAEEFDKLVTFLWVVVQKPKAV